MRVDSFLLVECKILFRTSGEMEGSISNHTLPRWMSVTGQPLEIGLDSGFRGKQTLRIF